MTNTYSWKDFFPVMFRGYLNDDVWKVLAELTNFYRQLCAKEIKKKMMEKLKKEIPMLLCNLENIFPPIWFNPMQHLFIHLPYKAKVGGPQQYIWMYHIEGALKSLKRWLAIRQELKATSQKNLN
jgi:hypothetical protein